ncbi:hypothetical protein BAU15_07830 [Enterococcus sp. JM4C]|uniref:AraC family transcriptional regulator n=1 Tax=Candidatus Enterococcus huntleyi TaxID=1857217 RepID=UPI00137A6BAD|nr:AraC family transcriptional regulator [Enterococcus sp. JM4C]KAF1297805.1 hypothetical protein BAU15_07830 [Enterococcus sp. JM4C]
MQNFVRQFYYLNEPQLPVIRGIGIGQGSASYDWDASVRKDQLIVFQLTISGTGYIERGGKQQRLNKNQAFFAKIPGQYRYYGEEWQFLFIEFSAVMLQWLETPFSIIEGSDEFVEELLALADELKSGEISAFENARISFDLFLKLKEYTQSQEQKKSKTVQQIKAYLDTDYMSDISLDQLADSYGMSKYKIIRQFEEAYKITPMNYLKRVRVSQSLSFLWQDDPIETVATTVGFSSGNYFSKVFKKEMGMTPSDYRNQKALYYREL